MKSLTMRDAFWNRVYELAKEDRDIVIVSADLGAPSLDKFRRDFPDQYINVGIAEQNAVLVASGLALAGKKPIAYAITQFLTLRTYEQFRIYPCGMKLPVTLVGVGAGACYSESGPTHHSIEDLAVMRTLPNLEIYNVSDSSMAACMADLAVDGKGPKFIRLDREVFPALPPRDIKKGFSILRPMQPVTVLATGNMVHIALSLAEKMKQEGKEIGVTEVFRFPLDELTLLRELKGSRYLVTLEEHTLRGGMGSYILEILSDARQILPVRRLGFDTNHGYEHCYNYGGREAIRRDFGIGQEDLLKILEQCYGETEYGSSTDTPK